MKTTYHTIIAGGTPELRKHIKDVLKMAEKSSNEFLLATVEVFTIDELEKELERHADIVFIDSALVIKDAKRLSKAWKKMKLDCDFALLLSDGNAAELKTAIEEMEKQESLPAEVHILKNNYPDELIMRVILRMIEFGITQKNMAVV